MVNPVKSDSWYITYYGVNDLAHGRHTSAYWNGYACTDIWGYPMPDVALPNGRGCAAPRSIELCSVLLVCTDVACDLCTVVDRMRDDTIGGSPHLDVQGGLRYLIPYGVGSGTIILDKDNEYGWKEVTLEEAEKK